MQVDLVERAQRGDREAFTALASQFVDRCYGLAYRVLRDPHRAQDASQQALLGAWRDVAQLKDTERFEAWLYRLVINACYAEARTNRRWNARVGLLAPTTDHEPDIARSVLRRDELENAFRQLSREQHAVVVLHHHLGYALTEIAEALG